MTNTATDYIREKLGNTIENRTSSFIISHKDTLDWGKYDEPSFVEIEYFQIKYVYITDLPGTMIAFDIVVDATCDLTFSGSHNDSDARAEKWLTYHCTGDLSDGLSHCHINEPEEWQRHSHERGHLSDNLVPYMYGQRDYENEANNFLRNIGYEKAINIPTRIDPETVAKKVNAIIKPVHITKDCHVFGQVFMVNADAKYYDSTVSKDQMTSVKAGTIFIDPDAILTLGEGGNNNSIIHECFHYYKYKKAFMLAKLANPDLTSIELTSESQSSDEGSAIYWMEKQTRAITPCIQMPMPAFKVKIENLINMWTRAYPQSSVLSLTELIIQDLAEFYGVSKEAARLRMIQIGYMQAIGAFNFVDGHYVPLHGPSNVKLIKGNQSYTLSSVDAIFAYYSDIKVFSILKNNHYVFIENHYCLFEPKYVCKANDGHYNLTEYARMHMEECCLLFTISFKDTVIYSDDYLIHSALNKNAFRNLEIIVKYEGNDPVQDPAAYKALKEELQKLKSLLTLSFTESIKAIVTYDGGKEENIAKAAGISQPYFSEILNGKIPSKEIIIQLCVALHLPDDISIPLLKLAGYSLTNSDQDLAYSHILKYMFTATLHDCNVLLLQSNCAPLGSTDLVKMDISSIKLSLSANNG